MANILLTWELGSNAGHVQPLGAIACELKARGHKVLMAVKDVCVAEQHLTKANVEFIQAPVWTGQLAPNAPSSVNYADLLMLNGYLNPNQVAGQIRSWMHLMEWVKPDLVLANHSPSILLASRIAGAKAITLGTSFHSPPTVSPMPSMQPYNQIPRWRLAASEKKALAAINQAMHQCGGTSLKQLSGIFDSCDQYLLTLPETDHYGRRKNTRYWGVIYSSLNTTDPVWPTGHGPKVYVYMQHHSKPFETLLESLKQLGWPSLIVSRNITKKEIEHFHSHNLVFSHDLVNLETAAEQADVVVTHCNHGTMVEMLRRGCRQLVIPLQAEQSMLAHRLTSQGLLVAGGSNLHCYCELLEKALADPILESNVKKFNNVYGKMDPLKQRVALVDDIEQKIENKSK